MDNMFQNLTLSNVIVLAGIISIFIMIFKGKGVYKSIGAGIFLIAVLLTVIKKPETFESIVTMAISTFEKILSAVLEK